MDLDHFHQVNKNYGYEIGDLVLKRTQDEIVSVLQASKYETLMERKGGDEFTVLAHCSALQVSQLTTKILNRVVAIDYSDVAEDLKVSITAGMAALRKRTKSYADLLHQATIKLYEAKRNRG
jgi:diguanylate cyclase (GGDEF)-like protein